MKALSVTRPWPDLILHHGKTVENRTWKTWHQGPLLIHAAKTWDDEAITFARDALRLAHLDDAGLCDTPDHHPTGIVGVVDLISVCTAQLDFTQPLPCTCGPWAAFDRYHWRLANPRPFANPIPCRGRLGLWTPGPELAAAIAREVAAHA